MNKQHRFIKIGAATLALAVLVGTISGINAYPPFLRQAKQLGFDAQDCTFCHTQKEGGEGWNERGKWLMAEKEKRQESKIDVAWLKDYKPAEGADKPKEGEKAEEPKKGKPEKP